MNNSKRTIYIVFSLLFLILLASIFSIDNTSLRINGDEMDGFSGVAGFVIALLVGLIAIFFAISVTGLVLACMVFAFIIVVGVVLGSIVLAFIPLLIPLLILIGLFSLFSSRKAT